jgi:hypothetical protein
MAAVAAALTEFVVQRHNHAGWFKTVEQAETAEDAMRQAIYAHVPWLMDYSHTLTINTETGCYVVEYTGEPRSVALGGIQYAGYWWSDQIHIGTATDCKYCGGTGKDHYVPLKPCWSCKGKPCQ